MPIPVAPVLIYPADGAIDIPNAVTFQWGAVVDADNYDIEVGQDPTFVVIENSGNTTDTSMGFYEYTMVLHAWYYFRVRGVNNIDGAGPWSTNTFYVINYLDPGLEYDNDPYNIVLLKFNGADESTSFIDDTSKVWTPNGNAKLNVANKRVGSACGYYDGASNAYITTPYSSDFQLDSNDYTIDFWIKTSIVTWCDIYYQGLGSGYDPSSWGQKIRMNPGGDLIWYFATGQPAIWISGVNNGNWHHIACVRSGSDFTMYFDGTFYVNATYVGAARDSIYDVYIGSAKNEDYTNPFEGYLDSFRFSKGIARWTSDFYITPSGGTTTEAPTTTPAPTTTTGGPTTTPAPTTTAAPTVQGILVFEGTGPVLINGDFIVQTGVCDMNGLDVQVGF